MSIPKLEKHFEAYLEGWVITYTKFMSRSHKRIKKQTSMEVQEQMHFQTKPTNKQLVVSINEATTSRLHSISRKCVRPTLVLERMCCHGIMLKLW